MSRRLLIGYDGSENGADALSLGALLAECLAATPLVVTVVPGHGGELRAGADVPAEELAGPILDEARQRLEGFDTETRAIVHASPAHALNDLAESLHPVGVVLGSAHRGGLGRVLLGSVGAALLSGSPSPIAVAPRGYAEREKRSVRRIGAALSGSDESRPAFAAAVALAGRLHASLTLLAVVEPVMLSHGGQYPTLDPAAYARASKERVSEMLDGALSRVPEGIRAERILLTGDPPALIAEAAADFDLLVLGSRAYGPIRRVLLGSVSAKLMGIAPCPVLVLPRSAGEDPLGLGTA
jgi:nucleotide-binding universal stress UspA family protein